MDRTELAGGSATELLRTLGDKYNAEILGATHDAMSAQELSDDLDVPIATCYRRIDDLTEADLLEHDDSVLTDDRRRVDVYRRSVESLRVEFDDGDVSIVLEERSSVKSKLDDAWRTLSDPQ